MRIYLVTDKQLEDLSNRLTISYLQANKHLSEFDQEEFTNNQLHRAMNYRLVEWIQEVKKESP